VPLALLLVFLNRKGKIEMSDYIRFKIENVSLTQGDWEGLKRRLVCLDKFSGSDAVYSPVKSTTKMVYSVDCGANTTESKSFRLAIVHYAKNYLDGIKITEI